MAGKVSWSIGGLPNIILLRLFCGYFVKSREFERVTGPIILISDFIDWNEKELFELSNR
jgi:hypothetical protein